MSSEPRVVVKFYESQQTNPAVPWDVHTIPAGTQATVKDGRAVLSVLYPTPRRVPARGAITVTYQGTLAQRIEYNAGIPSIRAIPDMTESFEQLVRDTAELAQISYQALRPGLRRQALAPPGVFDDAEEKTVVLAPEAPVAKRYRDLPITGDDQKTTEPSLAEIEAKFPGYSALPSEKWVQMNPKSDAYVVLLKLKKLIPDDAHRDADGVYYIYGIEHLAVHISTEARAPIAPNKLVILGVMDPKTDREKILVI